MSNTLKFFVALVIILAANSMFAQNRSHAVEHDLLASAGDTNNVPKNPVTKENSNIESSEATVISDDAKAEKENNTAAPDNPDVAAESELKAPTEEALTNPLYVEEGSTPEVQVSEEEVKAESSLPAIPAPVPGPKSVGSVSEESDRIMSNNMKEHMNALDALKVLLGDIEKVQAKGSLIPTKQRYLVKPGETLDIIIEKKMQHIPIRRGIVRRAFVENNPHAFLSENPHRLLAGVYIKIPNVDDIRAIIFPRGIPEETSENINSEEQELKKEDRKSWVRYP